MGPWYRPGTLSTRATVETLDHDVPSLAEGVMMPHGIDDLQGQQGDVNLGTSHDTRALACDNVHQ